MMTYFLHIVLKQKKIYGLILAIPIFFALVLPAYVFAEAPVVDDSENFALLEEQTSIQQQGKNNLSTNDDSMQNINQEEVPLAKEASNDLTQEATVLNKIQGMQQELQELRGQLEVQAHDLKLLKEQQLAFYKDLDARVPNNTAINQAIIPNKLAASVTTGKKATTNMTMQTPQSLPLLSQAAIQNTNRTNPAEEQISYLAAYDLVKNKRFDEALTGMQDFIKQYPQSGYAANAYYWVGELYLLKREYAPAINYFELVLQKFPTSSKSAASSLKIGYVLDKLGKKEQAKLQLERVLKNYPDTPAAQLAFIKLKNLHDSHDVRVK